MLVISQGLVLADETIPDGTPLILWDNRVTTANVSADSEDASYPATNLANPATNQEWRGSSNSPTPTEVDIDVDINSVDLIDGVGIARHNFGTEQIAVSIYSLSADSPPVETLLAGPQIPPNDEPMLFQFTATSFVTLRVHLDIPAATVPRAAVLYAGPLLIAERGFDVGSEFTPPRFARKTTSVNGMSHAGDFLGRIITSQAIEGAVATWKHFTPAWYRDEFDPFVAAAQRDTPFFFAWSPDGYPYEVAFAWLSEDPLPLLSPVTDRFGVSLKMDGIVE